MKERIYRIVKEKCGMPRVGLRWALVVTMIAASVTVGVALAQRRPARLEPPERNQWPAAEERERQVLEEHMTNLKNRANELKERFPEIKMELTELEESGKGENERARALRIELREMERAMANLERELHELEDQRRQREMRPWPDRAPRQEILRRLEELGHETELVLQNLADQRIGRNEEANMLYGRMRELNEQMQQVRQQLGRQLESPGRQRREFRREAVSRASSPRFEGGTPSTLKILHMEELREKARQIELELQELGDENPERVDKLHAELREIHEAIAQIERDVSMSREPGEMREMRQRELQEQAQMLERRLQELRDDNPDEAQELRMQLDQIHGQMERIEREPGVPGRPWPRIEEPMQPGSELRREQFMVRREHLQARLQEIELVLGELNEQGKAESDEARMHSRELRELQEQLQATNGELRKAGPGRQQERGRDDLEREVQDLRRQMDSVNEQMSEMRKLMERLVEKSESPKAG